MSTAIVPISRSQLPAHLQKGREVTRAVNSELATGVTSSFPMIGYRGKVWRVKKAGEEKDFVDRNGDPIPSIEVVFVKSNPRPSKIFYEKKWEAGDNSPPRCWSSNGLTPDVGVQNAISKSCASCPKNAWGSRISDEGKKGRACNDVRRMVVVFRQELEARGADAHLFLMRIPPASLNPLKDYAEKALDPAGIKFYELATRVGFDSAASHPKLTFRPAVDQETDQPRFLTESELAIIETFRESEDVARILSEEPEYAEAGSTGNADVSAEATQPKATPAPVSAAKAAPKPRPVDEEVDVEDAPEPIRTVRPATPVPQIVEEAEEEEDPPPPPPPKPAKKKVATKPAAPAEDENAAPAAAPASKSVDDILDALLG